MVDKDEFEELLAASQRPREDGEDMPQAEEGAAAPAAADDDVDGGVVETGEGPDPDEDDDDDHDDHDDDCCAAACVTPHAPLLRWFTSVWHYGVVV